MPAISPEIDVQALADLRAAGSEHTVLDVREPHEIDICALPGSLCIPMQQIPYRTDDLPRDRPLVVLCHHGTRSRHVTAFLRQSGFANASNLAGGIDAWALQIDPTMARY